MARPSPDPTDDWQVVEEVFCADGNNDRAIRDFEKRRPDLTGQPKRLRTEILCDRDSGASTVRFLWNNTAPEPKVRRKPRWNS